MLVVVRGGNDIASAVAHRLFRAGYCVLILEAHQPATVRRRMAYASAIYEGEVILEGVRAVRGGDLVEAQALLEARQAVPVLADPEGEAMRVLAPPVVVDARLRKKERGGSRVSDAPLVIGLGPGFLAGVEAHRVIETNRGANLGRIIDEGEADPYTGEPVVIEGHGRDRYLYAPKAGTFRTALDIGSLVEAGQIVGEVEGIALAAQVAGMIRGIAKDGLAVAAGTKLVDIDPRAREELASELSEKAWTIAEAVLEAIRTWPRGEEGAPRRHGDTG
jgi:xanthine dehydrogenase accessory factor